MRPRPRTLAERARALGARRAPPGGCARRLLRAGAALSHHGQRAPRPALSAVRRRRARHAGADHRAHGARARLATRSRTAAPRPATTRCASRWRCARSRRTSRCSRRCATRPSSARRSSTTCSSAACRCRPAARAYSINRGLWGVTIGGQETLTSAGSIPEEAWLLTRDAFTQPRAPSATCSAFEQGRPVALDGKPLLRRWRIIEALEALAAPFGIGRGIHLGDTIIGTKGRVAFEAPAAEVLLSAHRELEKLVLTARQQRIKELVAQPYGDLVHEGQLLDPVCRDIEALLLSLAAARHRRRAPAAAAPAVCSSRASSRRSRSWRPRGRVRRGGGRVVGD